MHLKNESFKPKRFKNILIVYKTDSPNIRYTLSQAEQWFVKRQVKTQVFSQSSILKESFLDGDIDLVLVLGGDGTYLQAVQYVSDHSIPFLGINMGSLGFLTVHRQESIIHCLDSILKGEMVLEKRSLIDISLQRKGKKSETFSALNDMVIERGSFSHLINISITIHNQNIYSVKADGLIVSSPTGSTAYNLAAGGPILHPHVNSFAVTPICSHSLTHRPVIVPDTYEIFFKINNENQSAFLTIDGRKITKISSTNLIKIRKSTMRHNTLRDADHNDFLLLKDKLKFSQ